MAEMSVPGRAISSHYQIGKGIAPSPRNTCICFALTNVRRPGDDYLVTGRAVVGSFSMRATHWRSALKRD
jgi:hypothetical protein